MEYESYGYHSSKHMTSPRRCAGNIKGLELEINDYDSGYLIDELIDEGIVTVPETEGSKNGLVITCEDDGSVYKELIFKASCNKTLLEGVKKLSEKFNGHICNGHGTSCHIHINNAYIKALGLHRLDIMKACEFLAPILFKISGRDTSSANEWARSVIGNKIPITNDDLFRRTKHIDNINDAYAYGRYSIVNVGPMRSTEIRLFSNYYNFDYDYIKMYIESTDFIVELAQYMKDKSYVSEYNNIIALTKDFFGKRKYKKIAERHNLKRFFLSNEERQLLYFEEQISYIKRKMNYLKGIDFSRGDKAIEMLRVLRSFNSNYGMPTIRFNIYDVNLDDIESSIIEQISQMRDEVLAQNE